MARRSSLSIRPPVPAPIARMAPALLAFAALGGPRDSIQILARDVEALIQSSPATPNRSETESQWLIRAVTLAFPDHRVPRIAEYAGRGEHLVDAQASLLRGDTAGARRALAQLDSARREPVPPLHPWDLKLDALFPEASVLVSLGNPRGAIAWIDPTLSSMHRAAPARFQDVARAGALVRAMALRAELADRVGDRETARQWARAVTILWSDADDFLKPLVNRMQRMAR